MLGSDRQFKWHLSRNYYAVPAKWRENNGAKMTSRSHQKFPAQMSETKRVSITLPSFCFFCRFDPKRKFWAAFRFSGTRDKWMYYKTEDGTVSALEGDQNTWQRQALTNKFIPACPWYLHTCVFTTTCTNWPPTTSLEPPANTTVRKRPKAFTLYRAADRCMSNNSARSVRKKNTPFRRPSCQAREEKRKFSPTATSLRRRRQRSRTWATAQRALAEERKWPPKVHEARRDDRFSSRFLSLLLTAAIVPTVPPLYCSAPHCPSLSPTRFDAFKDVIVWIVHNMLPILSEQPQHLGYRPVYVGFPYDL